MRYLVFLLFPILTSASFNLFKDLSFKQFNFETFKSTFNKEFFAQEEWVQKIKQGDRDYSVKYQVDKDFEDHIKGLLKRYRSDFTSVVVIDNKTGSILAAVDYNKAQNKFGKSLAFSSTHPAASLIKVVTAADLLENADVEPSTNFSFSGKGTTLYKYQLKNKKNRWTRTWKFQKAFALSNNVVFGKAAINHSSPKQLFSMAKKFRFNQDLLAVLDEGKSMLDFPESDYNLAEVAAGFNRTTLISPFHGAVMASIISNDGIYQKPSLIREIQDNQTGRTVWSSPLKVDRVISADTTNKIRSMMVRTVKHGTARSAFKKEGLRYLKDVEVGGKTGSITGGAPFGKRDWFMSYAKKKGDSEDKGISLCVMIVNLKKWYVKSPFLAKKIIQYYYKNQ